MSEPAPRVPKVEPVTAQRNLVGIPVFLCVKLFSLEF